MSAIFAIAWRWICSHVKLGIALLILVVLMTVAITFTIGWRPFIGPRMRPLTNRKFESTPERLARGRYIFSLCPAAKIATRRTTHIQTFGQLTDGAEGSGEAFPIDWFPGEIFAPNLTPDPETGVGTWTDDELAPAPFAKASTREGRAMFPIMPYENFASCPTRTWRRLWSTCARSRPVKHALCRSQSFLPR